MGRLNQGAPEIFAAMKVKALRSLESKEVLKRLVTVYCADCARKASGPLRESETHKEARDKLKAELGKAEVRLTERPSDAMAAQKVAELRRGMASANRDYQREYRNSREWVESGEQVGLLLSQELSG